MGAKTRYSQVQKLMYTVLITKRNLRHYFELHSVTVVTLFPLGEVTHNPDISRRIAKWAPELMVQYLLHPTNNDQTIGLRRLHHGVDRYLNGIDINQREMLDHAF